MDRAVREEMIKVTLRHQHISEANSISLVKSPTYLHPCLVNRPPVRALYFITRDHSITNQGHIICASRKVRITYLRPIIYQQTSDIIITIKWRIQSAVPKVSLSYQRFNLQFIRSDLAITTKVYYLSAHRWMIQKYCYWPNIRDFSGNFLTTINLAVSNLIGSSDIKSIKTNNVFTPMSGSLKENAKTKRKDEKRSKTKKSKQNSMLKTAQQDKNAGNAKIVKECPGGMENPKMSDLISYLDIKAPAKMNLAMARLTFKRKGVTVGKAKEALEHLHELRKNDYAGLRYDSFSGAYDLLIVENSHFRKRSNVEEHSRLSKLVLWKREDFSVRIFQAFLSVQEGLIGCRFGPIKKRLKETMDLMLSGQLDKVELQIIDIPNSPVVTGEKKNE